MLSSLRSRVRFLARTTSNKCNRNSIVSNPCLNVMNQLKFHLTQIKQIVKSSTFRNPFRKQIPEQVQVVLLCSRLECAAIEVRQLESEPGCWKVNAFHFRWNDIDAYAFAPFAQIAKCFARLYRERASLVLITPMGRSIMVADRTRVDLRRAGHYLFQPDDAAVE